MDLDGNCVFRTLADQFEGDQKKHAKYRQKVVNFIRKNKNFASFLLKNDETREIYCKNMEKDGEWGDELELAAAAQLYKVNILIHRVDGEN